MNNKHKIFVILVLIGMILVSGCNPEQDSCSRAGGELKTFPDNCVDRCGAEACAEVLTAGCDCGEDKCWNGNSCEGN